MFTIRDAVLADAAGIARVHVESWCTTYPGIMPQEHLDALSVAEREQMWRERLTQSPIEKGCTLVAETEHSEIVGFARGIARTGDPEYAAEVQGLYLLQAYQGQGLGKRLMQEAARCLHAQGFSTLMLWTHVRNPARGFYEALGGAAVRTAQRVIQGITYDDVGYGWDEAALRQLLGE